MASSGSGAQTSGPGLLKKKISELSISTYVDVNLLVNYVCCLYHFEKVKPVVAVM